MNSKRKATIGILLAIFSFLFLPFYYTGNFYGSDTSRTFLTAYIDMKSTYAAFNNPVGLPIPPHPNETFIKIMMVLPIISLILCLIFTIMKTKASKFFAIIALISYPIALVLYANLNDASIINSTSKLSLLIYIVGLIINIKAISSSSGN
jgi:hypothetical protein